MKPSDRINELRSLIERELPEHDPAAVVILAIVRYLDEDYADRLVYLKKLEVLANVHVKKPEENPRNSRMK